MKVKEESKGEQEEANVCKRVFEVWEGWRGRYCRHAVSTRDELETSGLSHGKRGVDNGEGDEDGRRWLEVNCSGNGDQRGCSRGSLQGTTGG